MTGVDASHEQLGWLLWLAAGCAVAIIALLLYDLAKALWRRFVRRRRPIPISASASTLTSLAHMYKTLYGQRSVAEAMSRPVINFATLRKHRDPLPPNHDPGDEDRT